MNVTENSAWLRRYEMSVLFILLIFGFDLDTEQQTLKIHCYIALVNKNSIQPEESFTLFNDTVSTVVPVIQGKDLVNANLVTPMLSC